MKDEASHYSFRFVLFWNECPWEPIRGVCHFYGFAVSHCKSAAPLKRVGCLGMQKFFLSFIATSDHLPATSFLLSPFSFELHRPRSVNDSRSEAKRSSGVVSPISFQL
jgi:hypothetical protein